MPKLGMTMEKGTIIKWLKKEGDAIKKGEDILEIETDKVTIKVEAPASGVLRKIIAKEKTVVPIGRTIAVIADLDEEIDIEAILAEETVIKTTPTILTTTVTYTPEKPTGRIFASPRAKKLAKEKNVDLKFIRGTGPNGRIIEKDVINYLEHPVNLSRTGVQIKETRPIEGIRKIIAERMSGSLQTAAQLTITMEIDVSELERFRKYILPYTEKEENIRVSYTEILVKVVSKVLEEYPIVNAIIEDNLIKILEDINIGIAVASADAVIVPVVHNANKKSLIEISKVSKDLIFKTRSGKLSLDELSKGTFTITNLGMFGVDIFTPILNPPESGILGVGRIVKKWLIKGRKKDPEITPTMQLSFTFDHRLIDGHIAAQFLGRIKEIIEDYKLLDQVCPIEVKKKTKVVEFPDKELDADVIVVGGGPAGYSAATRAAQLGLKVILVEKTFIGGVCVNEGCIPSKTMIKTVKLIETLRNAKERDFGLELGEIKVNFEKIIKRKNEIVGLLAEGIERNLDQLGVKIIKEQAIIKGPRLVEIQSNPKKELKCKRIIIATGLKFEDLEFDKDLYISNRELLNLKRLPKSMIILGIREPSLEYATIFNELGVDVKVIGYDFNRLDKFDKEIVNLLISFLEIKDIEIISNAKIVGIQKKGERKLLKFDINGKIKEIETDLIVNLLERKPDIKSLIVDWSSFDIFKANGKILTDEFLETQVSGVFAVGDIQNDIELSHTAMYEGTIVAENLFNKKFKVNYNAVPHSIYTFPEIASVGMTEEEASQRGNIKIGKRAFGYNSMARIIGEPEGLIKIIADTNNKILGIHIIGPNASELLSECVLAVGKKILDIALNFNQHPTLSEIINECAWQLYCS